MPVCPQCTKNLSELTPRCPTCQADLTLLLDYVSHLQGGLERAENLTRAGELGQAVWAYLEVLEVDPDNAVARRQVGQVATAVRRFDSTAPGRRWLTGMRGWWPSFPSSNILLLVGALVFLLLIVFIAFTSGYGLAGGFALEETDSSPPAVQKAKDRLGP